MTHRQIQAGKWLFAYCIWQCALFLWNAGWYDNSPLSHEAMGDYLFFTLLVLLTVGIVQSLR